MSKVVITTTIRLRYELVQGSYDDIVVQSYRSCGHGFRLLITQHCSTDRNHRTSFRRCFLAPYDRSLPLSTQHVTITIWPDVSILRTTQRQSKITHLVTDVTQSQILDIILKRIFSWRVTALNEISLPSGQHEASLLDLYNSTNDIIFTNSNK